MHLEIAIKHLLKHLADCNNDKYRYSPIQTEPFIFGDETGKSFNIGNAVKYLSRYMTVGFVKSDKPEDLLKAIHYIMMEYQRIKMSKKTIKFENNLG